MDHYTTLGVSRNATQDEIKKAFRTLAMQHHPDKGGDLAKFQEITNAYETLSDANKRAAYDRPATNPFGGWDAHGGTQNGLDLNDLFGQIFGNRSNPFSQQQQVMRTRIGVSLVDAYNGTESVVQLSTPQGIKVINIKIPAGVTTGDTMRYENIIPNGTLIVEFVVNTDYRYERRGKDLYSPLRISVLDLITGTKVSVQTISGKVLDVTIKPITQPSAQIRLSGFGMPAHDGTTGDQILLLDPFIPDNINIEIIDSINRSKQTIS